MPMDVRGIEDGEAVLERFRESSPFDLAVLDIALPGMDGFTLCQETRRFSRLPMIMLTARDDKTSTVVGLEVGTDDYMTKPFSPRELVSRVRAHLRRQRLDREESGQRVLEFPGLTVDLTSKQASYWRATPEGCTAGTRSCPTSGTGTSSATPAPLTSTSSTSAAR